MSDPKEPVQGSQGQSDWLPDLAQARQAFNRAADSYDEFAVLQQEVQSRTLQRLEPILLTPKRVLDLGCGTGHGVQKLTKRFPKAQIVGGDFAEQMVRKARGRQRWWQKRRYAVLDAHALPFADGSFDLIYSSLTLQWCMDIDRVFAECKRVLRPGGLMQFSSLGPDTLNELRQASTEVDGGSRVNLFLDMHDVGDAMVRAGFDAPILDLERIITTYKTVRDLAHDLKGIGAHNVTAGRQRGMTSRQRWRRLNEAYEQFRADGRLPATWEVYYAHGWAPEPTPQMTSGSREVPIQWYPKVK